MAGTALGQAAWVMQLLLAGEFELIERCTGGQQRSAAEIRDQVREIGLLGRTVPPAWEPSGGSVVHDSDDGWWEVSLPFWSHDRPSDVVLRVSTAGESRGGLQLRYHGIGRDPVPVKAAAGCLNLLREVDEFMRAVEERSRREDQARTVRLRSLPAPRLEVGDVVLNNVVVAAVAALVSGQLQGFDQGPDLLTIEEIRQALDRFECTWAVPPQGVAPDTDAYPVDDEEIHVETWLWTEDIATDVLAVLALRRSPGRPYRVGVRAIYQP